MKRSEMVTLLEQAVYDNASFDLCDGSKVLKALEEAGMLPPPKELENVTARVKYYYPFGEVDEDVTYHTNPSLFWEPEDE